MNLKPFFLFLGVERFNNHALPHEGVVTVLPLSHLAAKAVVLDRPAELADV
jgi:hypothetical protein